MSTDDQILETFRKLKPRSFAHTDGFTCFPQMEVEFNGVIADEADAWVEKNGGHLKHVKIPAHLDRNDHRRITQPDMEPCYFVPDELLA